MVQTLFDIISRASFALGTEAVQSFNDGTKESATFSVVWRPVLDSLITLGSWSFASADAELSRLVDAPVDPRYTYQFQLPADWLASRFAMDSTGNQLVDEGWIIQGDRLLSNEDRVFLKYLRTFEQAEIADLPVWFVELYVRGLALAAHESLNAISNVRTAIEGEYSFWMRQSKLLDGRGEPTKPFIQPGRLRIARNGG